VRPLLALPVALVLVAGCGSGTDLSASAEALLKKDAAAVAAAARSGDGAAVQAAVAKLKADLAAQVDSGGVSAQRADRVLAAAARVASDVPAPKVTPTPTRTASPVATQVPRKVTSDDSRPTRKDKKHRQSEDDHDD
jgi:hypothetical protein